jgi:hypothetical protein
MQQQTCTGCRRPLPSDYSVPRVLISGVGTFHVACSKSLSRWHRLKHWLHGIGRPTAQPIPQQY